MMKKETTKTTVGTISVLFVLIALAMCIISGAIYHMLRLKTGTTETTECEVIEKYDCDNFRHNKSYFLTLCFENERVEHKGTVAVSEETFYDGVTTGDKLLCKVTYDEKGIVEMELAYTDAKQITISMAWGVTLILLIIFAGTTIISVWWRNTRLEKEEQEAA